jgi:CHASE1-domain containing sensor protein
VTTPERLRRRQRIESVLVVIVIVLSCLSTTWLMNRQKSTQQCLEESVQDLTNALQVRSTSTNQLLGDVAGLVLEPNPDETTQANAFRDLLVQYQTDNAEFDRRENKLVNLRAQTPYPDYPDGKCD